VKYVFGQTSVRASVLDPCIASQIGVRTDITKVQNVIIDSTSLCNKILCLHPKVLSTQLLNLTRRCKWRNDVL